jgi:hypothetical protein
MIDRERELGVGRQAKALGISRGSVYYLPRPTSDADLVLMRRIDELHLDYPFAGSRMLMGLLKAEGHEVGRLHVSRLWQRLRGPCLVGRYLGFYNGTRPHSSLGGRTPDQAWLNQPTPIPARRHNHGGDPLSSSPDIVQTNRATSLSTTPRLPNTHCGAKERSRVPVRAPGSSSRRMDAGRSQQ